MFILLTIVHMLVCIFLIIVVLLQSGKAADLAGAFGGMGSQTAFGPRGSATLLSKATTLSAVVFMITSMALSILATRTSGLPTTVLEQAPAKTSAPAKPGTPAPAPAQQQQSQQAPATTPDKQPSVTVFPEGGGKPRTIPLNIPKNLPKDGTPVPVTPGQPPAAPAK